MEVEDDGIHFSCIRILSGLTTDAEKTTTNLTFCMRSCVRAHYALLRLVVLRQIGQLVRTHEHCGF